MCVSSIVEAALDLFIGGLNWQNGQKLLSNASQDHTIQ